MPRRGKVNGKAKFKQGRTLVLSRNDQPSSKKGQLCGASWRLPWSRDGVLAAEVLKLAGNGATLFGFVSS